MRALLAAGLATVLSGFFLIPPAAGRTLDDVRGSGALRICVAGSSARFYQANAEAFARFLKVRPDVRTLGSFDEQFQNAEGTVLREARYEARRLADGTCDLFPNDLHVVDWRESKMRLVPYYTVRKVVVAHRDARPPMTSVATLAGRTAAVMKGTAYDAWLLEQNRTALSDRPISIVYATTAESVRLVGERAADFTVIGSEGVFMWVRVNRHDLDIAFPVDEPVRVGWGVASSAESLAKELTRFFAAEKRLGSDLDRSWRAQYGISLMEYGLYEAAFTSGSLDVRPLLPWLLPAVAAMAVIVAAVVRRNRRLARDLRSEAYFRTVFENTGAGIIIRDRHRRVVDVNSAYLDLIGYTRDELERMPAFGYTDPGQYEEAQRQLADLQRGVVDRVRSERRYVRKTGEIQLADVMTTAIRGARGEVMATITIAHEPAAK